MVSRSWAKDSYNTLLYIWSSIGRFTKLFSLFFFYNFFWKYIYIVKESVSFHGCSWRWRTQKCKLHKRNKLDNKHVNSKDKTLKTYDFPRKQSPSTAKVDNVAEVFVDVPYYTLGGYTKISVHFYTARWRFKFWLRGKMATKGLEHWSDITVVVVYFILVLFVGLWVSYIYTLSQ